MAGEKVEINEPKKIIFEKLRPSFILVRPMRLSSPFRKYGLPEGINKLIGRTKI